MRNCGELTVSPARPCDLYPIYPEPPTHSVPTPGALPLLLVGLVLMRVMRRKK